MAELSKPAARLWKRLSNPSNYYPWNCYKIGRYMQELIDAGLVVRGGRVRSVAAYWMPAGYTPLQVEQYPKVEQQ